MSVVVSVFVVVAVIVTVIMTVIVTVIVTVIMTVVMTMIVAVAILSTVTRAFLTTSVHVAAFAGVQNLNVDQVEDEGEASDAEHDGTLDLRRIKEALGGLVEEPNGQDPDREDGTEGADDLNTVVAEGVFLVSAALGNLERND
jgi:hypothetical protein